MKKNYRSKDHVEALNGKVFLERIPAKTYKKLHEYFDKNYGYKFRQDLSKVEREKGNRRICPYFLGLHHSLAKEYLQAVNVILKTAKTIPLNDSSIAEGFYPLNKRNLTSHEKSGNFSFAYLDVSITSNGLKFIEFQAFPTYPFAFSKWSELLVEDIDSNNYYVDPNCRNKTSNYIKTVMKNLLRADSDKVIAIVDIFPLKQRYRFETIATKKEINKNIYIVDIRDIWEKNNSLYFKTKSGKILKINIFYNRLVPDDAKRLLNYPYGNEIKFRYDKTYNDLIYVNHPYNFFRFSKRLLTKIKHPFIPRSIPLDQMAKGFKTGKFRFEDYVWKRIEGYAGIGNFVYPTSKNLLELEKRDQLSDYVCQERVEYFKFNCGDGKLRMASELRLIMVNDGNNMVFCGASWGEFKDRDKNGKIIYKASGGEPGYGLMPVVFFT